MATYIFDAQSGIGWNDYGGNYLSVGFSQDNPANPPVAGWYFVDDNNQVKQLLNDPLWFSGGNPSPYPNGAGWMAVVDSAFVYSTSNPTITFYDTIPTPGGGGGAKIEFTGGFTITPNNSIPPGIGNYYLAATYSPATNAGMITIPKHDANTWSLDFNDVNQNTGNAIYINFFDSNNNNNSTYLNQLVGNHTHLTFTQNSYHITFDCTNQAWENTNYGGNQVYHDPTYEGAPQNSISIISTSGVAFNDVDPIAISIQII